MINLNVYDDVKERIDKKKTWVSVKYKTLCSREIRYRPYNLLAKRYNTKTGTYSYYIILLDNKTTERSVTNTYIDEYGRFKMDMSSIWDTTSLNLIDRDTNITIYHEESHEDGDVYLLDI